MCCFQWHSWVGRNPTEKCAPQKERKTERKEIQNHFVRISMLLPNLEIEMVWYHKHKTGEWPCARETKVHYKIFLIRLQPSRANDSVLPKHTHNSICSFRCYYSRFSQFRSQNSALLWVIPWNALISAFSTFASAVFPSIFPSHYFSQKSNAEKNAPSVFFAGFV